ncbi:MAG: indolepyruvate oxidoreductase subunit beta [Candidatus Zixiibacteriota bacterium]|nr:MAG: indolepyruvate oxidoreductase subunit beta [candidate division Zixibacteria bacterium]
MTLATENPAPRAAAAVLQLKSMNILIVGVGGQGVLLASAILSEVALLAGYDVKKSEVHGMSQRGGVVSSHVRLGTVVHSPVIPNGAADVILAFEKAEALRWVHELKAGGFLIVNDQKLVPPIAVDPKYVYPDDALELLQGRAERLRVLNAAAIARKLGNERLANTVLLGALSTGLDIDLDLWRQVISRRVPKGTAEANLKAFEAGRNQ